jgi:hypothetical protein
MAGMIVSGMLHPSREVVVDFHPGDKRLMQMLANADDVVQRMERASRSSSCLGGKMELEFLGKKNGEERETRQDNQSMSCMIFGMMILDGQVNEC